MKEIDETLLVEVFTGSLWEAELIKGLLESNGIHSVLKDGITATIAPYLITDVTASVTAEDYEAAMEIIRNREETEGE